MCERSGVINVAIEGQMLAGAWTAALIGTLIGATAGMVAGAFAGALIGSLLAVFAIRYLVNQVVLGVVLNVFAAGLTGFFYDAFMQPHAAALNEPPLLENIKIPLLGDIPVIGPLFFDTTVIVYLTYVLIVAVDVWLFRTRWGLRTRAVGEHPKAADTVGIKVLAMRYRNVIIGGAIAGLGRLLLHLPGRPVPEEHHLRQRLHRPRRPDLRPVEPPRRGRGGAAVRLRVGDAGHAVDQRTVDPVDVHRDAALRRHDRRGGRAGREGPRAGGRRRALRQGVTPMSEPDEFDWDALRAAAVEVSRRAYAPYSHFPVGAAASPTTAGSLVGLQRRERGVRRRAVRRVRPGQLAARAPGAAG